MPLVRFRSGVPLVALLLVIASSSGALAQQPARPATSPAAPAPQVSVSRVSGTLSRDAVRQLATRSWPVVAGCVTQGGTSAARVTVRFEVGASRRPERLSVRAPRAASACVQQEISQWQLPADAGHGLATVAFRTSGIDASVAGAAGRAPIGQDVLRAGGAVLDVGQGLLGGTAPMDTGATGGILQAPAQVGQAVVGALTGQRPTTTPAVTPPPRATHAVVVRLDTVAGALTRREVSRSIAGGRASLTACIDERVAAGGSGRRRVQIAVAQGRITQRIGAQGSDEIADCVDRWLAATTFVSRPEPTGIWISVSYRPRGSAARSPAGGGARPPRP